MKLGTYVRFWLLAVLVLGYECWALNFSQASSLLFLLKRYTVLLPHLELNPEAGKPISLVLGWSGFGLILLSNFYVLRKRIGSLRNLGKLSRWLDFHILCGLLGPTLILFHTNFKVRGLVAISFWSMVVSFLSGIVGRYFYVQLVSQKSELETSASTLEAALRTDQYLASQYPGEQFEQFKTHVTRASGAREFKPGAMFRLTRTLFRSMAGDLRLRFEMRRLLPKNAKTLARQIRKYAVARRRVTYLEQFRLLMGYWHSFHMPFAVFMYVVAAIHITTALLFMVPRA